MSFRRFLRSSRIRFEKIQPDASRLVKDGVLAGTPGIKPMTSAPIREHAKTKEGAQKLVTPVASMVSSMQM